MHPFSPFTSQTDRSFYTLPPVTLRNPQNAQSMSHMSGSAHPFATQLSRAHRPKPTSCFTTLPDLGRPKSRINSLLSPQISRRSCAHCHSPPAPFRPPLQTQVAAAHGTGAHLRGAAFFARDLALPSTYPCHHRGGSIELPVLSSADTCPPHLAAAMRRAGAHGRTQPPLAIFEL